MALVASSISSPAQGVLLQAGADGALMYALPVLGFMLLFYGVYQVVIESRTSSRRKMQDRLRGKRTKADKSTVDNIIRRGALGKSGTLADAVLGKMTVIPKLQTLLDQADVNWSASQTLFNLVGVGVLLAVGLFALSIHPLVALASGAAVMGLPILALTFKRRRRMTRLTSQLPDVFDMLSQALRAGHSLAGAVQNIYEQMPPPIATEFAQVYHEQNLGVKIEDALSSMANRVDSLDVRFFVTAVMIQRQTGGDLAEVLDKISGVIRERIELAGLVRGLTAEGRLSGWVLFALPIAVFVASMFLNPDYGRVLLEDPKGQMMLMAAGGMQLMGIAMIRWIVNIKV
ncbi:MAG: type II secretion system F family protein [Planctomycetes bacterium]|nr:type II secretion system F family protein [Planctomycetota bacterium]